MRVWQPILAAFALSSLASSAALPWDDERIVAGLPKVPAGLNADVELEILPSQSVSATYTITVTAPSLRADEWIVFAPCPPPLAGQRILSTATNPPSEIVPDLSPLKQRLWCSRIQAADAGQRRSLTFATTIEAELFSRRLVPRRHNTAAGGERPKIADVERRVFLRRTPQFDYLDPRFKTWAEENGLARGETEGEVTFGRRVFLAIVRSFKYEYLGNQDRSAGHVCTANQSDCGGMAVLFATALRSQGIPARTLAGRWAVSAKAGEKIGRIIYHQEHVKAEFFAQGVGWVPVDLSSGVLHDHSPGRLRFFGNDRGDFLTLHLDNDLRFNTRFFGVRQIRLMQRPAYWVKGGGSTDSAVLRESWVVTAR